MSLLLQSQKEFKNQTKFQSIFLRMNDTIPDETSWSARQALSERQETFLPRKMHSGGQSRKLHTISEIRSAALQSIRNMNLVHIKQKQAL